MMSVTGTVQYAPGGGALEFVAHPHQIRSLRVRLATRQSELSANIAAGYPGDWAAYREQVGVLKGLTEALDILATFEKEMESR